MVNILCSKYLWSLWRQSGLLGRCASSSYSKEKECSSSWDLKSIMNKDNIWGNVDWYDPLVDSLQQYKYVASLICVIASFKPLVDFFPKITSHFCVMLFVWWLHQNIQHKVPVKMVCTPFLHQNYWFTVDAISNENLKEKMTQLCHPACAFQI